jgi:hypothetical protein
MFVTIGVFFQLGESVLLQHPDNLVWSCKPMEDKLLRVVDQVSFVLLQHRDP